VRLPQRLTAVRAVVVVMMLMLASLADVVTAPAAHACSCVGFTDEQAFDRADVVFVGQVAGRSASAVPWNSSDPAVWTFAVERVYKGSAAKRQGVVSAMSGASCGLEVERGKAFVVFARRNPQSQERGFDEPTLYANLCEGTRAAIERPVPATFGQPRVPAAGESGVVDVGITSTDLRWLVAGTALAVAVGATLLAAIVRRRRSARSRTQLAS
jgi:hypothetical protein